MIDIAIITMKGNTVSEELSRDCLQSLKKFNYSADIFPAIYGKEIVSREWKTYKLKFRDGTKQSRQNIGIKGCFLSHYLLWNRVIETRKPLLILEHDAVCLREIPKNLYVDQHYDVLNLDAYSRLKEDYEDHLTWPTVPGYIKHGSPGMPMSMVTTNQCHIPGAHAYIIQPSGARKIVDYTNQVGALPADIALNNIVLGLYRSYTSYFRINKRYWIPHRQKSSHSYTRNGGLADREK